MRILPPSRLCNNQGKCSGSLDSDILEVSGVLLEVVINKFPQVIRAGGLDDCSFRDRFVLELLSTLYFRCSAAQLLPLLISHKESISSSVKASTSSKPLLIVDGPGEDLDTTGVEGITADQIKSIFRFVYLPTVDYSDLYAPSPELSTDITEAELELLFRFVGSTSIQECQLKRVGRSYLYKGKGGHLLGIKLGQRYMDQMLKAQVGRALPESLRKKAKK